MKSLAALRKNKKGFTLVEVIVVLVILAILAAILVPTLTGYIDKANERAIIAETRSVVMAAQTIASEQYGLNNTGWKIGDDKEAIADLAEVTEGNIGDLAADNGKVTKVEYTSGGHTCTYTIDAATGKGTYKITPATPPAGGSGK